jgi:NAD(P)-dependent dehydrogenase (short-subunit alcohol dehydrogenase family)
MDISGSVALVTGANRGIGAEFVRQLRGRGAAKVYAAARDPRPVAGADGIEAIQLDVTVPEQVTAAAAGAPDVDIVINNAGITNSQPFVGGDLALIREEFEANLFGPLLVARAFAPVLAANGGGALVDVLSAASWLSLPGQGAYSASKAAAWSMTDGLRGELADQGTQVLALHMGLVDTDMGAEFEIEMPRISPVDVVGATLDGLEAGAVEVLADDVTKMVKDQLGQGAAERYAALGG